MNKIIFPAFFFIVTNLLAQVDSSYSKFLILKTQAIDYYPVWGKNDHELYINLMSKEWRKYDLSKCNYVEGSYYSHKLAINTSENWTSVSDPELISKLETDKKWQPRELKEGGNVYSIEIDDFNTILYFQKLNGRKEKIMNIKGNAHSLAISPGGKYLACIFELSGLIIFDIENEFKIISETEELLKKLSNLEKAEYALSNNDFKMLEATILNCNEKEKQTTSYSYYYGLILYFKSEQDKTLIPEAIKNILKSCDDFRFYDSNILLSSLYQEQEDWENSLKFAEKSINLLPDHPSGYKLKADYYEFKGEKAKSCEFYKKAYEKGDEWSQFKLIDCE